MWVWQAPLWLRSSPRFVCHVFWPHSRACWANRPAIWYHLRVPIDHPDRIQIESKISVQKSIERDRLEENSYLDIVYSHVGKLFVTLLGWQERAIDSLYSYFFFKYKWSKNSNSKFFFAYDSSLTLSRTRVAWSYAIDRAKLPNQDYPLVDTLYKQKQKQKISTR